MNSVTESGPHATGAVKPKRVFQSKTSMEASRRRAFVLGVVEEAMRAFIDVGVSPSVAALQLALPALGWHAIRLSRARLIRTGVVELRDGLAECRSPQTRRIIDARAASIREALGRKAEPAAVEVVETPEAVTATRMQALDFGADASPTPRRTLYRLRREVCAAMRRERELYAWAAARSAVRKRKEESLVKAQVEV